jgi:hypothetical protein
LKIVVDAFDVILVVKRLVVEMAFDAYKFPTTCRFDVGTTVPIPTRLLVGLIKMLAVAAATPDEDK